MNEQWKDVVGYETLYEVSDSGRVRSKTRFADGNPRRYGGRVLRQSPNRKNGYLYLTLCDDIGGRKRKNCRVHVLVLRSFVGEPPHGKNQTRHLNGDKTDNRLANLSYGTAKENAADRWRHGTTLSGTRHPMAKLSETQIAEISRLRGVVTQREIGRMFGVTQACVSSIQLRALAMTIERLER